MIKQTIISHKFYSSEVCFNGWLTFTFYPPFNRWKAERYLDQCKIKALEIIQDEEIKDKTNVIANETYTLN